MIHYSNDNTSIISKSDDLPLESEGLDFDEVSLDFKHLDLRFIKYTASQLYQHHYSKSSGRYFYQYNLSTKFN